MKTGKLNLITDVEGVLIGNAHDKSIKSGVTVFTSEKPFRVKYFPSLSGAKTFAFL